MAEITLERREELQKIMDESVNERFQHRFEDGDKHALLEIIVYCAIREIPLPKWVRETMINAKGLLEIGKLESWDEIFGKPYPKGMTRKGAHTRAHAMDVWIKVRQLVEGEGRHLDEALFEEVGKKLGLGRKSTVSKLYYDIEGFRRKFRK